MKLATLPLLLCAVILLSGVSESIIRLCPHGWSLIRGRCFRYVSSRLTWAQAERNCLYKGGNLASVHSPGEYRAIQRLIFIRTHRKGNTWIGGSDSAQENMWLWSDGRRMTYTNWCPHEPNNNDHREHCLEMNFSGRKCWNDLYCLTRLPSVCARKRYHFWIQIGKKEVEE